MEDHSLHVEVRYEDGSYWAHIKEWPGCLVSGETLDEPTEALEEAIAP